MSKSDFLLLIDELLELDSGTLKGPEQLEDVGWSSLAVVGFIATADERFGCAVSPTALVKARTPDDLVALLGDRIAV